jgi:FixJ family two-component response regulator
VSGQDQIVYVVDDDTRVCEAICDLLAAAGIEALSFGSVAEYTAFARPDRPACLILDVELPDINGLEFQRQAAQANHPPIVFITGHGDIPSSVRAIKGGAVDFLTKPFADETLLDAVRSGVAADGAARQARSELVDLRSRLATLTPREREVLPLVVSGLLNKQAAQELGISETTLEIHRGKIMRKMNAASLADLVRIAARLGIEVTHSRRTGAG